jgi:glyoxylase-like metal-dependent hydrolase (beta-lactamase superfamily II)
VGYPVALVKIHHLNCGTMCPIAAKLMAGEGSYFERGSLVCHCLLIETDSGLVLVDTGFGIDDVRNPIARHGIGIALFAKPSFLEHETAVHQVERLGFTRRDVRHIVVTHLDFDHAGGLPDFPDANVHIYAREHDAAMARVSMREKNRYAPRLWAHGPKWTRHDVAGDSWLGFDAVRLLDERNPEIMIVPLIGHTRGHAGVAVRTRDGYVLHAGDAYFFRDETDPVHPRSTRGLSGFQRLVDIDHVARVENQKRLQTLRRDHGSEVSVFCAHDPVELYRVS